MRLFAAVVLSLAMTVPAADAAAPRKVAAARDWSGTVARAPSGAFVMGNPQAKVKLIEYASLTCSHCAAFEAEGWPKLKADYIRRGVVSLELRHAVRDRADMAGSLLARCTGPRGYYPAMQRMFSGQEDWLPRAAAVANPAGDTPAERNKALVDTAAAAGFPALAGMTAAAAAACIADPAGQAALGAMADEAWGKRKIPGTPTFLINGTVAEGASWDKIEPQLAAALH